MSPSTVARVLKHVAGADQSSPVGVAGARTSARTQHRPPPTKARTGLCFTHTRTFLKRTTTSHAAQAPLPQALAQVLPAAQREKGGGSSGGSSTVPLVQAIDWEEDLAVCSGADKPLTSTPEAQRGVLQREVFQQCVQRVMFFIVLLKEQKKEQRFSLSFLEIGNISSQPLWSRSICSYY